jgi:hypothetical protein
MIYEYVPDSDRFSALERHWSRDSVFNRLYEHRPLRAEWPRVEVQLDRSAPRDGDFPSLTLAAPVFSEHALGILRPLLGAKTEILPLICGSRNFYLINVLDVIDCLDHSRAVVDYDEDRSPHHVVSYAFHEDSLSGRHLFKVPESQDLDVLISERFKETVEQSKLKGLLFKAVG